MKYKVHRLEGKVTKEHDRLEQFLNNMSGEVVAVIPNVVPFFLCYGSRVNFILVIEKIK